MTLSINTDQAEYWNSRPGQQWVTFDADLEALHSSVTGLLMEAAQARPGEKIVDIGCGTGAMTFALAAKLGPSGHVEGIDISAPLIGVARERQDERGADNIAFSVADAQDHAFAPERYDMAISRFGVMFFSDSVAAFRNIQGALKPGGRIVFAAWAGAQHNPWFSVPLESAVERLGPVTPAPPDAPGPLAFRDVDRVTGLLQSAGFIECRSAPHEIDLHHPGGLDAVLRIVPHVGPIARMMKERGGTPDDRAAILEKVADRFGAHATADGIRIPARINIFNAHGK